MCCLLWRYMSVCVFAFWGRNYFFGSCFVGTFIRVYVWVTCLCPTFHHTRALQPRTTAVKSGGRSWIQDKKKKNNKKSGWLKVLVAHLFCVIRAAQRRPDPPGLWVDSPGTLAVRLGAAPLVLQVAWEAELPYRGEGLGLLDNPKSAWSSHAKAAASGKDTRVLNSQNKERRTRDSLFFFFSPPCSGTKVHIFARYSFCKREDLGALESCNLPLHSSQSCNTVVQSHRRQNKLRKLGSYDTKWTGHTFLSRRGEWGEESVSAGFRLISCLIWSHDREKYIMIIIIMII